MLRLTLFFLLPFAITPCAGTRLLPSHAQPPEFVAIRAGKVITLAGPPVYHAVVLIRGGKIAAVGAGVPVPRGAKMIDASTRVVMPGLVAGFTGLAERADAEEGITPEARASDAFDFYGNYRRLLEGGVTTAYVATGQHRLVSGRGAVVKLAGESPAARMLRAAADVRVMLGDASKNPPALFRPPVPPTSDHPILPAQRQLPSIRPSEFALLRQLFAAARRAAPLSHHATLRLSRPPASRVPDELTISPDPAPGTQYPSSRLAALAPVLSGAAPLRVNAHRAADIRKALQFADEQKIRIVLEGATEAYQVSKEIARRGVPVVAQVPTRLGKPVPVDFTRPGPNGRVNLANVVILKRAGVRVALAPPVDEDLPDLLLLAACEAQHGLAPEAALRTVTADPAAILGVARRVGTLAPGSDADLLILSGDPLDTYTRVDTVLVDGKVAYERRRTNDEGRTMGGRNSEFRIQKSGVRSRKSGVGVQKSGVRSQKSGVRSRAPSGRSEVGRPLGDRKSEAPIPNTQHPIPNTTTRFAGTRPTPAPGGLLAIRAGRILTITQGEIANGVILLRGGKIEAVLREPLIPPGASVIDASGSVLMPGMIDAHCHLGLHADAEPASSAPPSAVSGSASGRTRLLNAVDPADPAFGEVLRAGVTAILLAPPTGGQVCGQGALLKTASSSERLLPGAERVVKEYAALCFNMEGGNPRMAQPWNFRELLRRARDYLERRARYEQEYRDWERDRDAAKAMGKDAPKEPAEVQKDEDLEPFAALFRGQIPAFVHAGRADEILNALRVFGDEFDLDVTLVDAGDAFRVADEIRRRGAAVALGPGVTRREKGELVNTAGALARAGARILFQSSATSGAQFLRLNAAYAARQGLDPVEALRALTINPARALKVDGRLGSIEAGKDADLVFLSGDPLQLTSRVTKVLVNGKVVYDGG
jgi:imidazolonepropionase-like amidohydrolase